MKPHPCHTFKLFVLYLGGHPAIMAYYIPNGNVHKNCGIHNKAAYILLTSEDGNGDYLFNSECGAKLFYLALSYLSETSGFIDSRRAIEKAAKNLFRDNQKQKEILNAIAKAFDEVGISYQP